MHLLLKCTYLLQVYIVLSVHCIVFSMKFNVTIALQIKTTFTNLQAT